MIEGWEDGTHIPDALSMNHEYAYLRLCLPSSYLVESNGTEVTTQQRANAFRTQSPRLQTGYSVLSS